MQLPLLRLIPHVATSSRTEILLVLSLFAATNEQHAGVCRHSFPCTLLQEKHCSSPEAEQPLDRSMRTIRERVLINGGFSLPKDVGFLCSYSCHQPPALW